MISNDLVQAAIIAFLKSKANIVALLVDEAGVAHPKEIREDSWVGDTFSYPNIRVDLGEQRNAILPNCAVSNIRFSILIFSERASSEEADRMAGVVNGELNGKGFTRNNVKFTGTDCTLIPAIRRDERTWRSEVLCQSTIQMTV